MKVIMLMNVKMPSIVGILTFISMIRKYNIHDIWEFESEKSLLHISILIVMSIWNSMLCWVEHEKSFITSGPGVNEYKAMYFTAALAP